MHTKSLLKAVSVIENISSHGALGLEQLHILTDMPKPTLKRILDDFEELDWVYRRLADKKYVLLKDVAKNTYTDAILAKAVSPILYDLFQKTQLPSDFVTHKEEGAVVIESSFGLTNIRKANENIVGSCLSLTESAAGRTCLNHVRDLYNNKIAQEPESDIIARALEEERNRGFFNRVPGSWEFDFKKPFDIRGVALPILYDSNFIGSINLYWDSREFGDMVPERYISWIERSAMQIRDEVVSLNR